MSDSLVARRVDNVSKATQSRSSVEAVDTDCGVAAGLMHETGCLMVASWLKPNANEPCPEPYLDGYPACVESRED